MVFAITLTVHRYLHVLNYQLKIDKCKLEYCCCQFERLTPWALGLVGAKRRIVNLCPELAQRWSKHLRSNKLILWLGYLPVWDSVCSLLVHGLSLSWWMAKLMFGAESILSWFVGYVWSDKSPVEFTKWNPQQPDSHLGQQPCVEMYSTGDWADTGCYSVKQFICKMPRCKPKHNVYISALGRVQRKNKFSSLPFKQAITMMQLPKRHSHFIPHPSLYRHD